MSLKVSLIVTCEHGGNDIPSEYASFFEGCSDLLKTHRGYDPGAFELSQLIAKHFCCPFFFSQTSRLLVDLNRSLCSRSLFSSITKNLSQKEREEIIEKFYLPYRLKVESKINDLLRGNCKKGKTVLHLSVHTFTPILDGIERNGDIGLLYDSKRIKERKICKTWQRILKKDEPNYLVRLNYPYLGTSDGFATYLRSLYDPTQYQGIELEVNQLFPLTRHGEWHLIQQAVVKTFEKVIDEYTNA